MPAHAVRYSLLNAFHVAQTGQLTGPANPLIHSPPSPSCARPQPPCPPNQAVTASGSAFNEGSGEMNWNCTACPPGSAAGGREAFCTVGGRGGAPAQAAAAACTAGPHADGGGYSSRARSAVPSQATTEPRHSMHGMTHSARRAAPTWCHHKLLASRSCARLARLPTRVAHARAASRAAMRASGAPQAARPAPRGRLRRCRARPPASSARRAW